MHKQADILIIDDSESDTMLMEEAIKDTSLSNSVHIVHAAEDGIKFINKKDQYENAPTPDLILLDLNMPGFNGFEFLTIVKEDPQLCAIPVIILSTSTDPKDISESYRLHANCFISKPVDFTRFKQIVNVINDFWLGIAALPPK